MVAKPSEINQFPISIILQYTCKILKFHALLVLGIYNNSRLQQANGHINIRVHFKVVSCLCRY